MQTRTTESDGDGVGDNSDSFPNDGNETSDSDGDGVGDNADVFPIMPTKPLIPITMVWVTTKMSTHSSTTSSIQMEMKFPIYSMISSTTQHNGVITTVMDTAIYSEGNNSDAFINNASQWSDTDGDGYGDNWGSSKLESDPLVHLARSVRGKCRSSRSLSD